MLKYAKGNKIVAKALNYLPPEKLVMFFMTMLNRLECVDSCHVPLGTNNDNVRIFTFILG
jgi:hypothetical protein